MTLRPIYTDIVSKLNQGVNQNEVLFKDVMVAINDAIQNIRSEYVSRGLAQSFAVTEQHYYSIRSYEYPFLYGIELENELMKTAPVTKSILSIIGYLSENEIIDGVQSFSVGDKAFKFEGEFRLYECVKTFSSVNTFALTFSRSALRQYRPGNGLKYAAGDVIFDGTSYWKLTSGFTNDATYTFVTGAPGAGEVQAVQVYWMEVGEAVTNPVYFEFDRVNELRLLPRTGFYGYTVKDNLLLGTPGIKRLSITYVPSWTDVYDLDQEVRITSGMAEAIKQRTLAALAIKFPQSVGQSDG